jgi:hypothetical protein
MKFFLNAFAATALAAGASVAYLASREDGREYLSQFGAKLSRGYEIAGQIYGNAKHAASEWYAQYRQRGHAEPSYPLYQANGAAHHEKEYSHSH